MFPAQAHDAGRKETIRRKAIVALLLDRFHLTLEDYAKLTDKQIFEIYLHPRDEDGSIDFDASPKEEKPKPEEDKPDTLESDLEVLYNLATVTRMPAAKLNELEKQLREKYGRANTNS